MQQDIIGQAIDLLRVEDGADAEGAQEVELRAFALLQVALKVLDVRAGRERAVGFVGEAFDIISGPDREKTAAALAATPSEDLAVSLLGFLRQRDPLQVEQAMRSHDDAGAMILAGVTFLQERHGPDAMGAYVSNMVRTVRDVAAAGEHPISAPSKAQPVVPLPDRRQATLPNPRLGLTLAQRINAMADFLRNSTPSDAQADALASIMASGLFLRDRFGEAYAVGAIRQVEGTVSQAAALDRWQPSSTARN